ncbi:hypothetical protein OY671_011528, partial [Metschnikowia pulcherrima]
AGKVLAAEFGNFLAKLQYFLHQRADNVLEKRHLVLRIVNSVDKFESSGQRVNLIGSVVVTHVSSPTFLGDRTTWSKSGNQGDNDVPVCVSPSAETMSAGDVDTYRSCPPP